MAKRSPRRDLHQEITDKIIDALGTAGDATMPWIQAVQAGQLRPVNVDTQNAYNGVNILSLWVSAMNANYPSNIWGTYKQWQKAGCQVRKGEKSSLIVFYKKITVQEDDQESSGQRDGTRMMAKASYVFNAAQVDGFQIDSPEIPESPKFSPLERAEAFVKATGATVIEGGTSAHYNRATDEIHMPDRRLFVGTKTQSAPESFYAVLNHELGHNAEVRIMPRRPSQAAS